MKTMRHGSSRKKTKKGIRFLFYPFAFFILNCMTIGLVAGPFVLPYINMAGIVFLNDKPTFGDGIVNIYDTASAVKTLSEVNVRDIVYPTSGEQFGVLKIASVSIEAPLFCGDKPAQLKQGVGCYTGAYYPGQGRTILIAGHNNTFFKYLNKAAVGDLININTNYGEYVYEVTGMTTARYDDVSAYDLAKEEENLILYTCHNSIPFGMTPYRQFAYAKYVSGPKLVS